MEVERVQDGPLKSSEITRFLEASKTSYKVVDSILTDKKEPLFQQRTLIEIASETKIRNSIANSNPTIESDDSKESELETEEQIKAEELENKRMKEEEEDALKINDLKKKEDELILQEKKEKEIYERGFSEGKIAADHEAQKNLGNGLLALESARKSMLDLNASHFINLREQIASQILKLASERAGLEISVQPEQFFTKIETLLETIGQTTQSPVVYLNCGDLDSLKNSIETHDETLGFSFKPREGLLSGDIVIEIGSISIKDTTSERSEVSSEEEIIKPIVQKNEKKLALETENKLTNPAQTGNNNNKGE